MSDKAKYNSRMIGKIADLYKDDKFVCEVEILSLKDEDTFVVKRLNSPSFNLEEASVYDIRSQNFN